MKSKKTLEIEKKIGESIEIYLERELETKSDIGTIAENLGVSEHSVYMWLHYYNLTTNKTQNDVVNEEHQTDIGENPQIIDRDYLEERVIDGWTIGRIARDGSIGRHKVGVLIKKYSIQLGNDNRCKRKRDTDRLLEDLGKSPEELNTTDFEKKINSNGSYKGVLTWYKRRYEVSSREAVNILLEDLYGIRIPIFEKVKLISFLRQDETARNLAIAATTMNGEAYDIEKILAELYDQQFPDIQRLHQLLQDSRSEIKKLVQEGVTNLGYFIGPYDQGDKKIVPTLLGYVVATIPEEQLTPTLEDRLIRALRNEYSPRFNDDSDGTMQEIQGRVDSSNGKKREIYQKVYDHYEMVLELGMELNKK